MNLIEYIRQSYQRLNAHILKSLGADDGLIEYLMMTPENTNLNMIENRFLKAEVQKYTITFDANGGSNPPAPIEVVVGEKIYNSDIDISEMIPRYSSSFIGWMLSEGRYAFSYDAETGDEIGFIPESDVTLFADWILEVEGS